ncbi:CLIP domain-containing serine protease HP8-like isoform X2 [Arctopsyche grandis]|uniref:CLIP domain-containing serine protease HP8-like isoform X2 n=1 Tax=Arctopsyche grandis TaxID=121162 RepID=UPI00406D69B6
MFNSASKKTGVLRILQKAACKSDGVYFQICCPTSQNFPTSSKTLVKSSNVSNDFYLPNLCIAESNGIGQCITLPKCNYYYSLIKTKGINKIATRLKNVICGYEGMISKVCCPFQSTVSTTIKRPKIKDMFNILPSKCGEIENSDRITFGNKTGVFEFPWMTLVAIPPEPNLEASFKCGGSIIHERYILTAAHCFKNANPTKVRVGEHNIKTDMDCEGKEDDLDCASPPQDIDVEETVIHPMYNNPLKQNDIALLRLKTPIDFTKNNVMAICLPLSEKLRNLKVIDIDMIVAGWGMTENFTLSEKLLQARIPVVANSKCAIGRRTMSENQLCAGGETKADSCGGDSGGPLMHASDVNGVTKIVQQGIVSFGSIACGTIGAPAVYTYVAKYIDWILNEIKN